MSSRFLNNLSELRIKYEQQHQQHCFVIWCYEFSHCSMSINWFISKFKSALDRKCAVSIYICMYVMEIMVKRYVFRLHTQSANISLKFRMRKMLSITLLAICLYIFDFNWLWPTKQTKNPRLRQRLQSTFLHIFCSPTNDKCYPMLLLFFILLSGLQFLSSFL